MAIVKRVLKKKKTTLIKPNSKKRALTLCTESNEPSTHLSDYSMLIYGAKKIGKTTLAAMFPDAYFLSTEPGVKALRVKFNSVTTWEEFEGYVDLLLEGGHKHRTIIIDTVDNAYEMCFDYVCKKEGCEHPNDMNDFGKTWRKIADTFYRPINRLLLSDMGVIILSHETVKDIEDEEGRVNEKIVPSMPKQAMGKIEPVVDIIGNYTYRKSQRFLILEGTEELTAGNRTNEKFLYKGCVPFDDDSCVVSVAMGKNPKQSYINLIAAFNNQQVAPSPEQPKPKKSVRRLRKGAK